MSGYVLDGCGYHDVEYLSDTDMVTASWQGFFDDESGIDHYVWCVDSEDFKTTCQNVGLAQQMTKTIDHNITNG